MTFFAALVSIFLFGNSVSAQQCRLPPSPPRGYYADSSPERLPIVDATVDYGYVVRIACRTGFQLTGGIAESSMCFDDGTFDPPLENLGRCLRRSTLAFTYPETTTTPQTESSTSTRRTTTKFTTTEELLTLRSRSVSVPTRSASPPPSSPPADTCTLPEIRGGFFSPAAVRTVIIGEKYVRLGGRVLLNCTNGKAPLFGSSSATCTPDLEWSAEFGRCEPLPTCSNVTIDYGEIVGNGNTAGSKLRVECNYGFRLVGAHESVCQMNGVWQPELGLCIDEANTGKACEQFPLLQDAQVDSQGRPNGFIGETLAVKCDNMGQLKPGEASRTLLQGSDMHIRCNNGGKWTKWTGRCETTCDELPKVRNGIIDQGDSTMGSFRNVKCRNANQVVLGASVITCCWNKQWTLPGTCVNKDEISLESQLFVQQQMSASCPATPQDLTYCSGWRILFSCGKAGSPAASGVPVGATGTETETVSRQLVVANGSSFKGPEYFAILFFVFAKNII